MEERIKEGDIEKFKRDSEFIKQTTYQIIKDFGMFGMDICFSENVIHLYNEVFSQLDKHFFDKKHECLCHCCTRLTLMKQIG